MVKLAKVKARTRRLAPGVVGTLVAALAVVGTGHAVLDGGSVDAQRLRAQVFVTQRAIPRRLTERGLVRFARSHNSRRLRETTDAPIPERKWLANMVTSFNRPPGDLEFQILFYDIEGGARRFIGPPMSTFVNNRDERTFVQRLRLERPQFKPNTRMELVVTVRRQEVGRRRFELVGERVQHSGEVSFSDDER